MTDDILKEYNITYHEISGNLFTGIKVDRLKYENRLLLDQAIVHWNPFNLEQKQVHITQLELRGLRPTAIMDIISSLKTTEKTTSTPKLDLDILVDNILLTSKPLTYAGVTFKNFQLKTDRLEIDKHLHIKSKRFHLSVDSSLTDIEMRGKLENDRLKLDEVQLLEIDPKVITSFVQEIQSNTTTSSTNSSSKNTFPLKNITIKTLFATMKTTTYGPVTIENTHAFINDIDIDPRHHFNYNAKEVTVSSDTSFASTTQKGFIKDSELFTTGDVITNEYLFRKYSLPLNQNELHSLPLSLKLNHRGIWLDIEHSVNSLLTLDSDFNIDLDSAQHSMAYEYQDKFITITSKAQGSTSYTEGVNINNTVNIDFRGEHTKTTYYGDVTATSITNIPPFLIDTLLQNPTASYRGGVDELFVTLDTNQISGSFFSHGYRDADIKIETKYDVLLSNFIPSLPPELQMAQGSIQSQSKIDFQNIEQSHFKIDVNSDLANLSADMDLLKPYHISYNATVPDHSLLYNIDPKIRFSNLLELNGEVILGEYQHHIDINNHELQLSFDYDTQSRVFNNGTLFINGQSIEFKGGLESMVDAHFTIQDINSLSNIIMNYYDILLPPIEGSATVNINRLADKSMNITLETPYISYGDMAGDIRAKIKIDAYKNIDINLNSTQLSYQDFSGDIHAKATIDAYKNIDINLNSTQLSYQDFNADIDAKITIDSSKNMNITLNSSQIESNNMRADITADVNIDAYKNIYVALNSHKISLLKEGEVTQEIHKLSTNFSIFEENITLHNYSFYLRNNPYIRHIFSKKPAYLTYQNGTIYSKELWFNDQINITGHYVIPTKKGKLRLQSDYFPYSDKDFDLATSFKLLLQLDKERVYVNGNVKLLGNQINYALSNLGLSEDSDIVIVQEMKEKEESILNNIKLYVTVENEIPLKYRTKEIHLNLLNEITIVKEYNKDINLLGKTKISKGYYLQEDKKFFLDESYIYFYGNPKDAVLDIHANYVKDKYKIKIFISGSSSDPIINFSSEPYLTQREILSLILFDTSASNSGAGTAVYAMLGGLFAKELIKNLGVPLDHFLLGEGIDERLSLELGEKISDDVTVIYQHENGRDGVKVKIDHNLNFETDIIIQPPHASSIEFLYKSD